MYRLIFIPNLGFLPQIIHKICSRHNFSRTEARGQGHSDREIAGGTLWPKDVSRYRFEIPASNNIADMFWTELRFRRTDLPFAFDYYITRVLFGGIKSSQFYHKLIEKFCRGSKSVDQGPKNINVEILQIY